MNNVFDKLILVSFNISSISGRKKLKKKDLKNVDLPPDHLISLGSKKTIDPSLLGNFNRIRHSSHSCCLKYGIPFLGGYAIPKEKLADVIVRLVLLLTMCLITNRYTGNRSSYPF